MNVYKKTTKEYCISRANKHGEREYLIRYSKYGYDKDGVYKIAKTKWTRNFSTELLSNNEEMVRNTMHGILKYDRDFDYAYFFNEITMTVTIDGEEKLILY